MGHSHPVYDRDAHFTVNASTRAIKSDGVSKTILVQHDHNSERITFVCPRRIEDHDLSECNRVEVHYLNVGNGTKKQQNSGLYVVSDLRINPEDEETVVCSWLVSQNATGLVGKLTFLLRFCCIENGVVRYAWNTLTASVDVATGLDAAGMFESEYVDVIEQWKESVMRHFANDLADWKTVTGKEVREEAFADILVERHRIDLLSNYVTPQMFGAKGDGVTDDTEAIRSAFSNAAKHNRLVIFPEGTYEITEPIIVPSGLDVSGTNAVIRKSNTTTVTVNETSVNTIFVVSGSKTYLHDIRIQGDVDNGVDGVTFDEKAYMLSVSRVTLANCRKCFNDIGGLFMAEFDRVHCFNSLNAFVFDTNRDKTSMTFKSCWAENCGQAYYLYRCQYTNLISCGADYCNAAESSPYSRGYGDRASNRGVYHFNMCRAVAMNGCGVENSWGNGAVCCVATYLTINGLVCTNVKSMQSVKPSERAVGMIVHNSEASRIIINSLFANNDFENVYVTENYPDADQYLIAYNYSNSAYGERGSKGIIASGLHSYSAHLLGGCGNYDKECLLLDEHGEIVTVENHLNIMGRKFYPVRNLTNSSGSDKLTIPFNSQSDANRVHLIRVTGISNAKNSNIPNAFEFTLEISSLNTANHAALINATSNSMSVATSGMNAVITLPASYTNLNISIETMSVKENLINIDGITLGAS